MIPSCFFHLFAFQTLICEQIAELITPLLDMFRWRQWYYFEFCDVLTFATDVLSFLVVQKDSNLSIIRSWNWQLSNVLINVVFEQIIFSFLKKREKKIVPNHALRRNWNFLGNAENGNAKKYESNSEFISNLSSTTRERSVNQYSEKLDGKSLDILL